MKNNKYRNGFAVVVAEITHSYVGGFVTISDDPGILADPALAIRMLSVSRVLAYAREFVLTAEDLNHTIPTWMRYYDSVFFRKDAGWIVDEELGLMIELLYDRLPTLPPEASPLNVENGHFEYDRAIRSLIGIVESLEQKLQDFFFREFPFLSQFKGMGELPFS